MKRFLKKDNFQLSLYEQEQIWRNIQAETGRGPAPRPRRFVMPGFGMTAVTAAALLLAVWLHDKDAPEKVAQQALHPETPIGTRQVVQPEPQAEPSSCHARVTGLFVSDCSSSYAIQVFPSESIPIDPLS